MTQIGVLQRRWSVEICRMFLDTVGRGSKILGTRPLSSYRRISDVALKVKCFQPSFCEQKRSKWVAGSEFWKTWFPGCAKIWRPTCDLCAYEPACDRLSCIKNNEGALSLDSWGTFISVHVQEFPSLVSYWFAATNTAPSVPRGRWICQTFELKVEDTRKMEPNPQNGRVILLLQHATTFREFRSRNMLYFLKNIFEWKIIEHIAKRT